MKLCIRCHKKLRKDCPTKTCEDCLKVKRRYRRSPQFRKYLESAHYQAHIREYRKSARYKAAQKKCRESGVYKARQREYVLKKNYGLTLKQRNIMLRKQHGRCYICRKPESFTNRGKKVRLAVDHDHRTDRVRGLLCHNCNLLIGSLENRLAPAKKYLDYLGIKNK